MAVPIAVASSVLAVVLVVVLARERLSVKGETSVPTRGFAGSSCNGASRFVEQALGERTSEQLTAEFRCGAVIRSHHMAAPHGAALAIRRSPMSLPYPESGVRLIRQGRIDDFATKMGEL
jgi:hypothetical protein